MILRYEVFKRIYEDDKSTINSLIRPFATGKWVKYADHIKIINDLKEQLAFLSTAYDNACNSE
jgi:hypothetical protein